MSKCTQFGWACLFLSAAVSVAGCGSDCDPQGYKRALSNIWPGVKIYFNAPPPTLIGTVENTDSRHVFDDGRPTGRAILIRTPSGDLSWRDRNQMLLGPLGANFVVRCDDPALR